MCTCSGCGRRGIRYGWLAFWGLVLCWILSTPNSAGSPSVVEKASGQLSDICQSSGGNAAEPMSTSRTPSYEEDQAMQRLLSEMEEQGQRLPKI